MNFIFHKLLACAAFISCLVWYAKTNFYRDPGSAFFDVRRAYEQGYSKHRQSEVLQYINNQTAIGKHDKSVKAGSNSSLCVALSSVVRKETQYLEV